MHVGCARGQVYCSEVAFSADMDGSFMEIQLLIQGSCFVSNVFPVKIVNI